MSLQGSAVNPTSDEEFVYIVIDDSDTTTDTVQLANNLFQKISNDGTTLQTRFVRKAQLPVKSAIVQMIFDRLADIFDRAELAESEVGNTLYFPDELLKFIDQYHEDALDALGKIINEKRFGVELIAEALSTIGRAKDPISHLNRLMLLINNLSATSPKQRYGAIRGLASLNVPLAIPYVEAAIRVEQDKILQHALKQLKERLNHKQDK